MTRSEKPACGRDNSVLLNSGKPSNETFELTILRFYTAITLEFLVNLTWNELENPENPVLERSHAPLKVPRALKKSIGSLGTILVPNGSVLSRPPRCLILHLHSRQVGDFAK